MVTAVVSWQRSFSFGSLALIVPSKCATTTAFVLPDAFVQNGPKLVVGNMLWPLSAVRANMVHKLAANREAVPTTQILLFGHSERGAKTCTARVNNHHVVIVDFHIQKLP